MRPVFVRFFSGPGSGVLLKRRFFLYSVREAIRALSKLDVIL
jgi:hypothetical protein